MKTNIKNYIPLILFISLSVNIYLLVFPSDSKLKNNAFCAEFKEQASKRIKTYYTNGDVENIYPDEIFYSKKRNSCVVVWSNLQTNYANNGYHTDKIIFDAITNENILSETFYRFNDKTLNNDVEGELAKQQYYDSTLRELRNK